MDLLKEKIEKLKKEADQMPLLHTIEEKTGVKAVYIFIGLIVFAFMLVFFGFWAALIANLVGFLYPAFKSMKALDTLEEDDDKQWLIYWSIYGMFILIDDYSTFFISYFPYYYTLKLAFIIWLYFPTTKGAILIYNLFLKSLFEKHHDKFDSIIGKIVGESKDFINQAQKEVTDPANIAKVLIAANEAKESVTKKPTE
jgi:receptor expression-enhancing protein 5/6